jgi:hypothetical protein
MLTKIADQILLKWLTRTIASATGLGCSKQDFHYYLALNLSWPCWR